MNNNSIVDLIIEDMSVEGQGIGRMSDGMVVFVEGAVKGDRVRAEIVKTRKRFAFAKAIEVLEESPLRSEEFDCPYREQGCGGCPLGQLDYGAQLEIKEKQVIDRLERIAGIELLRGGESEGRNEESGESEGRNEESGESEGRNERGGESEDRNEGGDESEGRNEESGESEGRNERGDEPEGRNEGGDESEGRNEEGDESEGRNERGGGACVFRPIVGMSEDDSDGQGPWRYRNKAVMKISTGGLMTRKGGVQEPVHEPRIGFYQNRTHDVVDCADCSLQIGTAMAAAEATRQFMAEDHICSYDDRWDKGLMKQMTVKTAFGTGEVMVIYDINGKGISNAAKLVEYLDDAIYEVGGSLESVVIRNDKKTETIAGKNTITDSVAIDDEEPVELGFEISANSFYQVNHYQMERLYAIVRRYLREAWHDEDCVPVVLDLYCGIGTIGLCIADIASRVHGVEIVKEAVNDANRNAVINGIVNATYTCGKAEEMIPQWVKEGREEARADIAILDPPRAGCRKELLDAVAFARIPWIIYVSCDPATLARDIGILGEQGYELLEATPVDMFPHTNHVECVVLMSKK